MGVAHRHRHSTHNASPSFPNDLTGSAVLARSSGARPLIPAQWLDQKSFPLLVTLFADSSLGFSFCLPKHHHGERPVSFGSAVVVNFLGDPSFFLTAVSFGFSLLILLSALGLSVLLSSPSPSSPSPSPSPISVVVGFLDSALSLGLLSRQSPRRAFSAHRVSLFTLASSHSVQSSTVQHGIPLPV